MHAMTKLLFSERDLRAWLRKNWLQPKGLTWIEQAHGSTHGVPDVILQSLGMPTELKVMWPRRRSPGYTMAVRPSQCRWHELNHRAGKRSLFLCGECVMVAPRLYVLPGHAWPRNPRINEWWLRLREVTNQADIEAAVQDGRFWEI